MLGHIMQKVLYKIPLQCSLLIGGIHRCLGNTSARREPKHYACRIVELYKEIVFTRFRSQRVGGYRGRRLKETAWGGGGLVAEEFQEGYHE